MELLMSLIILSFILRGGVKSRVATTWERNPLHTTTSWLAAASRSRPKYEKTHSKASAGKDESIRKDPMLLNLNKKGFKMKSMWAATGAAGAAALAAGAAAEEAREEQPQKHGWMDGWMVGRTDGIIISVSLFFIGSIKLHQVLWGGLSQSWSQSNSILIFE